MLDNLFNFIGFIIGMAILNGYFINDILVKVITSICLIVFVLPIFIVIEWYGHKDVVRKFHDCFRTKIYMKRNKALSDHEYFFVEE